MLKKHLPCSFPADLYISFRKDIYHGLSFFCQSRDDLFLGAKKSDFSFLRIATI